MNKLRIATIKPQYILNDGNYPSFLGNDDKTVFETAQLYIANLFKGSIEIDGLIQNYLSLSEIAVNIEIDSKKTYQIIFNSGYLEITISDQKYYYFVNNVNWVNDNLLILSCHLDYWLTYWALINWNPNNSCFIKRKHWNRYDKKLFKGVQYIFPNLYQSSFIHNDDSNFHYENFFSKSLVNLAIVVNSDLNQPHFVNQLSLTNPIYQALLSVFGVFYLSNMNIINTMYYAFVAPNINTNLVFEKDAIRNGNLPSGCYLIPIVTNPITNEYINHTSEELALNTYDIIANLGNNYVVSIVSLPLAVHFWSYLNQKFTFEKINIPFDEGSINLLAISIRDIKLTLFELETKDITTEFEGRYIYPLKNIAYEDIKKFLNEPKLLSNEFTKIYLNISDTRLPLFNFNVLEFLDNDLEIVLKPWMSFSLAPHLYNQIIRFKDNYLDQNFGVFNSLNLTENGIVFHQDLQLISTSSSYNNFITGHKNSYNVSLAQGKLGVQNQQYSSGSNLTKFFNGVEGGIKGYFGGSSASSGGEGGVEGALSGFKGGWNQGNRAIQGAKLNYKQIQATTKDLKREAFAINDSNTSDTYGFLTKQNFNYNTLQNNYKNLNTYGYISIYQLPFSQLFIIDNFYALHGYLIEGLMVVKDYDFFRSRLYFDYFEINNISTVFKKINGFNLEVIDWFNTMFEKGLRLWHNVKENDQTIFPNINDYRFNNWEINIYQPPKPPLTPTIIKRLTSYKPYSQIMISNNQVDEQKKLFFIGKRLTKEYSIFQVDGLNVSQLQVIDIFEFSSINNAGSYEKSGYRNFMWYGYNCFLWEITNFNKLLNKEQILGMVDYNLKNSKLNSYGVSFPNNLGIYNTHDVKFDFSQTKGDWDYFLDIKEIINNDQVIMFIITRLTAYIVFEKNFNNNVFFEFLNINLKNIKGNVVNKNIYYLITKNKFYVWDNIIIEKDNTLTEIKLKEIELYSNIYTHVNKPIIFLKANIQDGILYYYDTIKKELKKIINKIFNNDIQSFFSAKNNIIWITIAKKTYRTTNENDYIFEEVLQLRDLDIIEYKENENYIFFFTTEDIWYYDKKSE